MEYSGFEESSQRTIITDNWCESYDDILILKDSDIVNLAKGFSDMTVAVGNTKLGLRWTNLLKVTTHWAHDLRRISRTPSLIGISNAAKFSAAIEASRQRTNIRKHTLEELASFNKAVDPGKLKRHKDWIVWSKALKN